MPTPKHAHRSDVTKWEAHRSAALDTLAHTATEGVSDDLSVAAFCLDVSYDLSLTGYDNDPIKILKTRTKYWDGMVSRCTRGNGRVQYVLAFPSYAHLLAFRSDYLDGVKGDDRIIAALVRIDAEYLYCANFDAPVDSFIDLNPLPQPD